MDEINEAARALGRLGGNATKARHGREHFAAIGQAGGKATHERYGQAHYKALGRKSCAKRSAEIAALKAEYERLISRR